MDDRPTVPDLRTLAVLQGMVQWGKRGYRNPPLRLHAVGVNDRTACGRKIPKHASREQTAAARPCVNCASRLSGVWRTGRPRTAVPTVPTVPIPLPDLGTREGREELLDAEVAEVAPAFRLHPRSLRAMPDHVRTVRDLLLDGQSRARSIVASVAGIPAFDPDALDAWVAGA